MRNHIPVLIFSMPCLTFLTAVEPGQYAVLVISDYPLGTK
jgi:hypothetical protein